MAVSPSGTMPPFYDSLNVSALNALDSIRSAKERLS
jgi:hypothetical protein